MKENTMRPASSRESISATSRRTRRVLDDAFKTKVFSGPKEEHREIERLERERDELHKVSGRKEMNIDFLKKNLSRLGLL